MIGKSWITDLVEEHQDVETPRSWLYWSLLCCVSAAAANNYTLRTLKGNVIYYPNIYVMLLGESGLGKGFPVSLAKRIITQADITRVIAGRSSIQAIIKELSTTRSVAGKPIITDSRGFIINGELSTAIIKDPDALTILTDLFDRNDHPVWTNLLKGDGAEKLKEPYVTCLFGSSPSHFYDSVPQANIEGGYIGRNLIVFEEKRAKELDLLDGEEESLDEDRFTKYIVPKYVPHLNRIAATKAKIVPNSGAREIFNKWRHEWRANQGAFGDKTGFVNRVPDHILKIAMCLCLARYDNCHVITEEDINEATEKVTSLVYANERTANVTVGLDQTAAQSKRVVDLLLTCEGNKIFRKELLKKGFGDFDPIALDRIIDTLLEIGWVRRLKIGVGNNMDWEYFLHGEPLNKLLRFRAQGNGKVV